MNVIKCDIEVIRDDGLLTPVAEIIVNNFKSESDFDGEYEENLQNEWNDLEYKSIKALNSSKYLLGYTTTKNIKVYVFEKQYIGIKSKSNTSLELIAFGTLSVEEVFNESIIKIQSILKNCKCDHVNNSQLFIYPFDTNEKDIYNYELKVKANVSTFRLSQKELIKWCVMLVITLISIFMYTKSEDGLMKDVYTALLGIGIVLVFDIIIYFLNRCFQKNKKIVSVNNLSSVVETSNIWKAEEKEEDLKLPGEE